jgi:hypothetical protein
LNELKGTGKKLLRIYLLLMAVLTARGVEGRKTFLRIVRTDPLFLSRNAILNEKEPPPYKTKYRLEILNQSSYRKIIFYSIFLFAEN